MESEHPFERRLNGAFPTGNWQEMSVVVAVSGGADSVALLRALARLKTAGSGRLWVAHFNHQWRGAASDADEQFVVCLAETLNLPIRVGRANAGEQARSCGDGLEAAARSARYAFLQSTAENVGARYVMTAHTADDQVETILQRIVRGTGLAGLAGMPRVRNLGPAASLVRPLLAVRRAEVIDYLTTLGQTWRDDTSNEQAEFTRNRIRHALLPMIEHEFNPAAREALLRLGRLAGEAQQLIEQLTRDLVESCIVERSDESLAIDARLLAAQPRYLVRETLVTAWRGQGWPEQAMGWEEWEALAELVFADAVTSPAPRDFPGGIRAQKDGARLVLARR